jgi:hypothetical protein
MENVAPLLFYQGTKRQKRNTLAMKCLDRLGLRGFLFNKMNVRFVF